MNFVYCFVMRQDEDILDDSDDEDDTVELMAELNRIKKERAAEQARRVCNMGDSNLNINQVHGSLQVV